MTIIPAGYYTLNAAAKTITFLPPYDTISVEEIVSIRNLPKQNEIYNSSDPRHHVSMMTPPPQAFDISLTGGVLTYVVTAGMANGDKLQIVTNTNPVTSPDPVEYFFNVETITASGTGISDPIFVGDCSLVWIWISQTASTDLTVNLYSESSDTSSDRGLIKPYTLGTSTLSCTDFLEKCPPYLRVGYENNDTVNSTDLIVKIRKTR